MAESVNLISKLDELSEETMNRKEDASTSDQYPAVDGDRAATKEQKNIMADRDHPCDVGQTLEEQIARILDENLKELKVRNADVVRTPSLSDDMKDFEKRVRTWLAPVQQSKENNPVVTNVNYTVSHFSMRTLLPEQNLNDEIINAYFKLIKNTFKVYTFDSYFFTSLVERLRKNEEMFKFLKKDISLVENDLLLCPINKDDHWTLIAVNVPKREVGFYDSVKNNKRGKYELAQSKGFRNHLCCTEEQHYRI